MQKQNKYIVMCSEDDTLYFWHSNIIYKGESALKIPAILELKKMHPNAKIYKLKEIKI